ncbi:VOC family protein [Paraburkholderia sp. J63]|uniref:VOC family protein n=1 Tax=Paraburkholderia sp. J63 TaxID=2805434 RepID=UPI002ABD3424|nr:VOC family protein [Paraburkholderia sp. J63]
MPNPHDTIRPMRLAHVVFRTRQLDSMIAWYEAVLGSHVVFRNDHIAFLTYDDEHHRIALIASPQLAERPSGVAVGFYHAAFAYASLVALMDNYTRLKRLGIEPWRSILHGPTVSQYYRDPDGNDIELQVDAFDTAQAATDWMRGEAFRRDPIGVLFDPERMIARLASGEPEDRLMRRPDA